MTYKNTILIYGRPKIGKTLDACHTFRRGFVVLSEPYGLSCVEAHLGFTPAHVELTNLSDPYGELTRIINQHILPGIKRGEITSVIFDTASEYADRLLAAITATGWKKYETLLSQFEGVLRPLLLSGVWIVLLCHETPPDAESGRAGGPLLPGKLSHKVPGQVSVTLHAVVERTMDGGQRLYKCDPLDPDWITGDRTGACFASQPMELKPIVWRMMNPGKVAPPEVCVPKPIRVGGMLEGEKK